MARTEPITTVVERSTVNTSIVDVLERVLDKGIVIDAWVGLSIVGIALITVEARIVVASIETYLKHAETVARVPPLSQLGADPRGAGKSPKEIES